MEKMLLNKLQLAANFLCFLVIKLGSFKQIDLKKATRLVGPDAQVRHWLRGVETSMEEDKTKTLLFYRLQIKYGPPKTAAGFQQESKPRNWNSPAFHCTLPSGKLEMASEGNTGTRFKSKSLGCK